MSPDFTGDSYSWGRSMRRRRGWQAKARLKLRRQTLSSIDITRRVDEQLAVRMQANRLPRQGQECSAPLPGPRYIVPDCEACIAGPGRAVAG